MYLAIETMKVRGWERGKEKERNIKKREIERIKKRDVFGDRKNEGTDYQKKREIEWMRGTKL